ncbi:MAG: F0F1 ATP synthase subunit B [Gammaproteobacteria bacterium]|nr:F0F1 ATP synthase subunit B [Gammaproteobacteria bacterium]
MDINATIFGQFITFAIFVWFTMKYVWPPVIKTIHDREKKIVSGLQAAEQSKRELEMAEHKAFSVIREAKQQATQIIEQANVHSARLVDEAKGQAKEEGKRIIEMAQGEIEKEIAQARETLKNKLALLAVTGAEKIIERNLDASVHDDLLNKLAAEI